METIKVKIVKCLIRGYWYSGYVGNIFDVNECEDSDPYKYQDVQTKNYIDKDDCTVLKPCFKSDGTAETGKRIIAELERLGGRNDFDCTARSSNAYYFVDMDGFINGSDVILENCYLAELPETEKRETILDCSKGQAGTGISFPETGRPEIMEPEPEKELTPLQELENLLHKITAGVKRDRDENILRLKTIQRMLKAVTTPDLTHKEKNLLCDVYCKQIEAEIKQEETRNI